MSQTIPMGAAWLVAAVMAEAAVIESLPLRAAVH